MNHKVSSDCQQESAQLLDSHDRLWSRVGKRNQSDQQEEEAQMGGSNVVGVDGTERPTGGSTSPLYIMIRCSSQITDRVPETMCSTRLSWTGAETKFLLTGWY